MQIEKRYRMEFGRESDMRLHMPTLVRLGKGKDVVEIGFRTGVSATAFLFGGCRSLVSVDIEDCPASREFLSYPQFRFVCGPSLEQSIEADVVMIDGDHRYEAVKADLAHWGPLARECLVLHDTNTRKWPGVRRALEEFLRSAAGAWAVEFEEPRSHGLTVLRRMRP